MYTIKFNSNGKSNEKTSKANYMQLQKLHSLLTRACGIDVSPYIVGYKKLCLCYSGSDELVNGKIRFYFGGTAKEFAVIYSDIFNDTRINIELK